MNPYSDLKEHLCERCHQRRAVAIFDYQSVCALCWQALDQLLQKEAKTK